MPEISIIVPVYKVEKYINTCVDSLLRQTFRDIEIILVDDGSPDNCPQICDDYKLVDDRIKVLHKINGGLSSARNAGIVIARGKYICFIDSDDYVTEDYCQVLYDLLDGTDYDYSVCGTCRFIDGDVPKPNNTVDISSHSNFEFLGLQLNKKTEFGVWNKLYRRELFTKIHFADGKIHEDVIWSADLANNCVNGVIENKKQCYLYRQRSGGIVAQGAEKCSPDRIYAGGYLIDIVKKNCPELLEDCLHYALNYAWSFVDRIYVNRTFKENKQFLLDLKNIINLYRDEYMNLNSYSVIKRKRMNLFSKSMILYGFNAYARLFRVYLYKVFKKDAYSDGHGI